MKQKQPKQLTHGGCQGSENSQETEQDLKDTGSPTHTVPGTLPNTQLLSY